VRLHHGLRVEFVLGIIFDLDRLSPMPPHSSKLRPSANHALFNNRNSLQVSSVSGNAATRQRRSFCVGEASARASERIPIVNADQNSLHRTGNSKTRGY